MARVLLVEDHHEVRRSIREFMEQADFVVDEAPDGQVALELLATQTYALMITDLWMPNVGGLDLLKHLRKTNPKMPVIAISGGAPGRAPIDYSVALAQTWGADIVIFKPFDNDYLVEEAKKLLIQYAA